MLSNVRFIRLVTSFFLSVVLIFSALHSAFALEADNQQPMNIQANQAEFNPETRIATYTGKVQLTQGSLKVKAYQLTIHQQENGEIHKVIARGKQERVHIQQKPSPEAPLVHALAMHAEYFASEQEILLKEQAEVENGNDRFTGDSIRYNLQSRSIKAWGETTSQDTPTTDSKPSNQVKIILYPQGVQPQEQEAPQ